MTLGTFLPIALLVIGIVDAILFRSFARRGMTTEGRANIMILVSLMLPLIAYVALNFAFPETGATIIW